MRKYIPIIGALGAAAVTLTTGASVAAATPSEGCGFDEVAVPEYSRGVLATDWLYPGDSVEVSGSESIWAGVWFVGENGPEGLHNTSASTAYPLPGARKYGLIGRIGNGPWRHVGYGEQQFSNTTTDRMQKVVLRVNDDAPGNGTGAFNAVIDYGCETM